MSGGPPVVAVLGLGEAGSAIAAGLAAAGAVVRGFDPRVRPGPGVTACAGDAGACRGAAVVVSLTCAHEAGEALTAALAGIGSGAIYADLNTASASTLDRLEQGSVRHAVRRIDEMAAAGEQLRRLGVPPRVASTSEQSLRQLAEEQASRRGDRCRCFTLPPEPRLPPAR
jgi:hypothetical protein